MSFPNHRGRRLRSNPALIESLSETVLCSKDLVMPYFVHEKNEESEIKSMDGLRRFNEKSIIREISVIQDLGINMISLFPVIPNEKKSLNAEEALNNDNLICRTLRGLKKKFPKLIVICDIALDAYTLSGHDGIINKKMEIDNDKTIEMFDQSFNSLKN